MKRHIGLIIDGLAGGGAERVVLTLAQALVTQGHRVTLVALRSEQAYPIPQGVEYLLIEDRYRGPLRRQTEISRRARRLDQVLRQQFGPRPFDLALSNLPKTDRIVAATPCLAHAWFCLHGAVASTQLAGKRGLKRWLKLRQLRQTYNGRRLVVVSDGLAADLRDVAGIQAEKLCSIPNPFDIDWIRQQAALSCPLDGEPFLVHVGRFHPVKRHDRLFAAFSKCAFNGKLVLVGTGTPEQQAKLRQQARDNGIEQRVVFAGFSDNPYPWLRAAHALILSSDSEGFGNVLIEALACGTPVISTRSAGPQSILTGELARGLCAPDETALAATIDAILADPPPLSADTLYPYTLENVVTRYLALATSDME